MAEQKVTTACSMKARHPDEEVEGKTTSLVYNDVEYDLDLCCDCFADLKEALRRFLEAARRIKKVAKRR